MDGWMDESLMPLYTIKCLIDMETNTEIRYSALMTQVIKALQYMFI